MRKENSISHIACGSMHYMNATLLAITNPKPPSDNNHNNLHRNRDHESGEPRGIGGDQLRRGARDRLRLFGPEKTALQRAHLLRAATRGGLYADPIRLRLLAAAVLAVPVVDLTRLSRPRVGNSHRLWPRRARSHQAL